MKTPPIFTKQQYRKWQIEKRMKKKLNQLIGGAVLVAATVIVFFYLR